MKRYATIFLIIAVLVLQTVAVSAMSASEAKQAWFDTKDHSRDMQEQHREAKAIFAGDPSPENEAEVVETGKACLHAALEEAEAWLVWKRLETEENPEIPDDLKDAIYGDVETNLEKIGELREEVDGVTNRFELGVTFLKMIGKYFELVADVARNSGMVWVYIGNQRADTIEDYAETLRGEAEDIEANEEIMVRLDAAMSELEIARRNIDNAEETYAMVQIPGTPLLKFSEGNNYLRAAQTNLVNAHSQLNQAYHLMVVR